MRALSFAVLAGLMFTSAASAETLVLRSVVTDSDGRITAGDVFENADGFEHVVLGVRSGQSATLDAGQVQSAVAREGGYWDNARGIRRILVTVGPDGFAPVSARSAAAVATPAAAQAGRTIEVLVLTRSISAGEIIQPQDLAYQSVQAHQAGSDLPSSPEAVIGKTARWALREGGVVKSRELTSPVVVRRSEQVQVEWSNGRMTLAMTGTAQKDGAVGDIIQVVNPTSKKIIDVVITGPGRGAVGPAAQPNRQPQYLSQR